MPMEFDKLLVTGVERGASDLHLKANAPVILRSHGRLVPQGDLGVITAEDMDAIAHRCLTERMYGQLMDGREVDSAYAVPNFGRFRVNMFLALGAVRAVLRSIPSKKPKFEELGLPEVLEQLSMERRGLLLVTGITGSGKSTTLAAMIDYINRTRNDHIITIEDPIEFVHPNKKCLVNQREIRVHTQSFKHALRAALREDPDIVLVGEMRDLETISIALETAETGHLVFGTLHTNTAPSTVDRIIDQFPADRQAQVRTMLSESLKGVITQVLCKKIGGGRAPAQEILLTTSAVSNLIREGKTFQIPSIMQTGRSQGMLMLNDALLELVRRKMVLPQDALAKAVAKAELRKALEAAGIAVTGSEA